MKLKFLGRGSAFNTKEGNTSAYIKQDDKLLLIDCGENIFERILDKKLLDDITEVNIAITHCHSDHIGSLSNLILYCYFVKHIQPNLYIPDMDFVNVVELMGVSSDYCNYFQPHSTDICKVGNMNFDITFIFSSHVNEISSYSIILFPKDKYGVIYYSGDNNNIFTNILKALFDNEISEFYQDTCSADYTGNVHASLKLLDRTIPSEYRSKVYCMHLDCDELIDKAKDLGFNVVEIN